MSGGSYDYLCHKDAQEILSHESQLGAMADRLAELGYAEDAAAETQDIIATIRQLRVRLETRLKRLNGVWHAVEWWDSCDSGPAALDEALSRYREDAHVGKWATRETGWCLVNDPRTGNRDCGYARNHDGRHSFEER